MAAPTWVAAGTFVNNLSSGSLTPGLPAGYTTDDIFILFAVTNDGEVAPTPSGWNLLTFEDSTSAGFRATMFWRRATASETAPTFTSPANGESAIIHAFRGCQSVGNPFNVTAGSSESTSNTSVTFPSITTTVDECMVVLFGAVFNATISGQTNANLTSLTERSDNSTFLALNVTTGVKATLGATGTTSATASANGTEVCMTTSLKPNAGLVTELNDSDTGTGSETESIQPKLLVSDSDTGTGTETESIKAAVNKSSSDSGTGTETQGVVPVSSGLEYVALSDPFALKLILGITDTEGLSDLGFNTFDLAPTIGMSQPFTYDIGWKDIINKIEVTSEKRYPTFSEEVVWEDKDTKTIFPGEPYVYKAKADDPFYDAVVPVAGLKSYSGSNQVVTPDKYDFLVEQGTVQVNLSRTSGQSVDITVTATGNDTAVISGMSLRAIPVKVFHTFNVKTEDVASQVVSGVKTPIDSEQPSEWMNINDARAVTEVILNQRSEKLPFVTFSLLNANDIRLRTMLDLRLSDRVDINETETFTNNDFYVEQITNKISSSGKTHETVLGCEQLPTPVEGAMIFDDEATGFDIGVFGNRANLYDFDEKLFIVGQSTLNGNRILGL